MATHSELTTNNWAGSRTVADIELRRSDRFNDMFIAGMWFQDLFNYDFCRTERCVIPSRTGGTARHGSRRRTRPPE